MKKKIFITIEITILVFFIFLIWKNYIVQSSKNTISTIDLKNAESKSSTIENSNITCTDEQKAIQEVAAAYYNKGTKAQYCSYRKSFLYPPEEATSQHTIYSVCSDFTYSVYYQAFGIQIPDITGKIIAYGKNFYDANNIKTNDIIEYWEKGSNTDGNVVYSDNNGNIKNIDLSTASGREKYANMLLREYNLQVGDVLCYHNGTNGHALLVYDIIYDSDGNPIDALIRESTSKYETKTTKITKGLSYASILNENTGITEGTFQERYLFNTYTRSNTSTRNSFLYDLRNMTYCTILRPLLKDEAGNYMGQYYDSDFSNDSNANTGYICTGRTLKNYAISDTTLNRMTYSSINIEKTVDVFNNTVVNLGDTLEYTIKVSNDSNQPYKNFDVLENISEYVDIVDNANGIVNNNVISWTIPSLEAGKSVEIKYRVKVKNDITSLEKQIISTGTVAGIASSTIKNTISNNLNNSEKLTISNQIQSAINSRIYTGQELISKIYSESLGISLNLEDLNITDLIITRNGLQYYPEGHANKPTVYLNTENKFSSWVLSNYYGALYTDSSNSVFIKFWENSSSKISGRTERADTIYNSNFETGDILIYKNTQIANDSVTYQTEDGTYYLIYISEEDKITINENDIYGFIGIDENGNIKNILTDFTSLQTILGKDYYVIVRPSLVMPQSIQLEAESNEIKVGQTLNLQTNIYSGNANTATSITFSSSDTNIATIDENGKIKGRNEGNCTITATTENGKTATFNLKVTLTQEQQAVIDVANAFYWRGSAIQYDDYSMTYQTSDSRKRRSMYTHTPEEATLQDIKYHVCSEYVHNIYYEAFSDGDGNPYKLKDGNGTITWFTGTMVGLANSSSKYYNSNIAVDYIKGEAGEITSKAEEYKQRILNEIEPGDIIIYRRGTASGHAIIYLGNDVVLNSTGYTYNYQKKTDGLDSTGTIGKLSLENDSLTENNVFKNIVTEIAIIRPLNEITSNPIQPSDYSISEKTLTRMQHNKLVRTKVASVSKYDSVNLGDEITYNITLENKSNSEDYKSIIITDHVPQNTRLINLSENGTNENGALTWHVDIPHGESITISYTVKIGNDMSILGTSIINDSTIADGIKLNTIETVVNNTLTSKQQEELSTSILTKVGNKLNRTEDFINSVYPDFNFPNLEDLSNMLFSTSEITVGKTGTNSNAVTQTGDTGEKDIFILKKEDNLSDENKTFTNMLVKGLFGGLYMITENEPTMEDGRNKTYSDDTFTIGDILFVYDDDFETDTYVAGEKNTYLYIGNHTFATVQNGEVVLIDGDNGSRLIESLLGQNYFFVLRPSYSMTVSFEEFSRGDINNDKKVDTTDLLKMLRHIAASKSEEIANRYPDWILIENSLQAADINNDEKIDTTDILQLLRHMAASKSEEIANKHPDWII